jgi:hypothetical protein
VDAEGTRFITGRSHHTSAIRLSADRYGPACQRWIVALFDRRVERVHVDVKDAAHVRLTRCWLRHTKT